jgi:hypothetical protein
MKKRSMAGFVIGFFVGVLFYYREPVWKSIFHDGPAPGFCIATNQFGKWRGLYAGTQTELFYQAWPGKQAAIECTWSQYEYDQRKNATKWTVVQEWK